MTGNRVASRCGLAAVVLLAASFALAQVPEREAIVAQTAAALASADFASRKCPGLGIGQAALERNLTRAGTTLAALRADESYADQRDTLAELERSHSRAKICALLPAAHGGYGRGIVSGR